MSMCSLTDFIEMSLGRCGGWVSTATVTGRGASSVDASVRGGDFSWPQTGTSLATSGDFSWPKPGTFSWPRTLVRSGLCQVIAVILPSPVITVESFRLPESGDAPITCQPLFRGLGSENSGQNIDESLEMRTGSYEVTRF